MGTASMRRKVVMRSESDEMAAGARVMAMAAAETREGVGVGDGVPTVLYVEGLFRFGLGVVGSEWLVSRSVG